MLIAEEVGKERNGKFDIILSWVSFRMILSNWENWKRNNKNDKWGREINL